MPGPTGADAPLARGVLWLALALVLAVAGHLRLQAARHTQVDTPIRADAAQYFWYAYNLKQFGTYSFAEPTDPPAAPAPDALRPPGYPLFLAALTDHPPTLASLVRIGLAQALIGVLVTLLTFVAARRLVGDRWALAAAALTAISPHLVNAGVYVLTETLFSLTLIVLLVCFTRRDVGGRWRWALGAGLLVGVSALVRGTSNYLPLVLVAVLFLHWPARSAWRPAAALLLGFALAYAPWAWRNAQLPGDGDDRLKINMLHHGLYPDFTYEGAPQAYGFPYRADPRGDEIGASMDAVLGEIRRRFTEEPGRHLRWYLLGKPVALWSWNEVQGMGDAFVYPVLRSPYFESAFFVATHRLAYWLHWPTVVLAALFCLGVWLPRIQRELPAHAVLPAQVCAAMLMYATALHMVGFPLPRYAVPFRPEQYLAACAMLYVLTRRLLRRRPDEVAPA